MSAVGMEDGAVKRGIERYEELTCEGEKPLTTDVMLLAETTLPESEDKVGAEGLVTDSGVNGTSAETIGTVALPSLYSEIVMIVGGE